MAETTRHLNRASGAQRRALLLAGILAGPLYVGIGVVEALVRDGFDITRHSLSLLANGAGGWIHSAMLVTTGLLTVLGAVGLARFMPASGMEAGGAGMTQHRSPWAVGGLAVFGLGVAAAGLLRADPAEGFPVGTPDGPPAVVTGHGIGHLAAGGIGFLGLIVACMVLARWFRRRQRAGWALFSLVTCSRLPVLGRRERAHTHRAAYTTARSSRSCQRTRPTLHEHRAR